MAIIKKIMIINADKDVGGGKNPYLLLVRAQAGTVTLEVSMGAL